MRKLKAVLKGAFAYLCLNNAVQAQTLPVDTTHVYEIPEVTVTEAFRTQEVRAASPTQVMDAGKLKRLNALQVSDAAKHFAGVTVKDYGGIGGLKTISLRSLGTQHTAVGYDGITLTDCQTGQIDIGRFSLENVDRLSLSNGQSDNIFQPARFFASAGVMNIQTLTPHFTTKRCTRVHATLKGGSFGLINPSLLLEQKLSNNWSVSAAGEWMQADGRYPFTLHYGNKSDSISREKRKNTQVETLRAEAALYGHFSNKEQWRLKAYYYQSSRGLPGAIIFYNPNSSQHLWDKNFFVQSHYIKELNRKLTVQTSAKWNWSYQRYLDPQVHNSEGKTENTYRQQEYYLSGSLLWRAFEHLSFSVNTDGSINTMDADLNQFARPTRYSWLTAAAAKYVNERITASASVLATLVNEDTQVGECAGNHHKFSPFLSLSVKPFVREEFRIRAFYKQIFRLPSFNDLYYSEVGNAKLKPENTTQYNIGLTYEKYICPFLPQISATVDAYYNKVTDKIVAIPTKNLFIWTMVNLGEAEIKGVDATLNLTLEFTSAIHLNLGGNYTYQRALDTTKGSATEGHQIAYVPRISGSGQAGLETPWVNLSYSILFAGHRYTLGENFAKNRIDGYTDHSLSASREFRIGSVQTLINVELLNLTDKNYEVIRYFPMPGRSIRATLKITY